MTNRPHHSLTLIQVGAEQIRLDLTAFEFLINEFFNVEKEEKFEQFFVTKLPHLANAVKGIAKEPQSMRLIKY